ncbi:type II toxin-antitoxin system PrlF family antitoxin [Rubrimonas sp.]|uniref:type II toxin-antitoxin system PrlF family antitoxin n=1 Tax=Rubrimonas sp. TaxID=2036015 RepID=UPI002FDE051E
MIRGRLTAKAQTTVPLAVRRVLNLSPGDEIVWTVEADGRVTVARAEAPADDPFAAFSEWAGEADARAYAEL